MLALLPRPLRGLPTDLNLLTQQIWILAPSLLISPFSDAAPRGGGGRGGFGGADGHSFSARFVTLIYRLSSGTLNNSVTQHSKTNSALAADGRPQFNCHLNGIYNKRRDAIMAARRHV